MRRFLRGKKDKLGLPPGSTIYVGDRDPDPVHIQVFRYDKGQYFDETVDNIENLPLPSESSKIIWVNVDGLHDVDLIQSISTKYGIHPLSLEDVLNTEHRPKYEEYDDYLLAIFRMLTFNEQEQQIEEEQVSLLWGKGYVLSFQERRGDLFEPIRDRIRNAKGKVRVMGSDYLAYTLIDTVIDNYYLIVETLSDKVDESQRDLLIDKNGDDVSILTIHFYRHELAKLRRAVLPLRQAIEKMQRDETGIISDELTPYLSDILDHVTHINEQIRGLQDTISTLFDTHFSLASHKMNAVMKVLTIIATIFMPLTFIVGIYGMNFKYMPELEWKWSYLVVWIVLLSVGGLLGYFFKRKKWL